MVGLEDCVKLGGWAAAILIAAFAFFLAIKLTQRHLFMRGLRTRMMTTRELHKKLKAGEQVHIIDLRHRLEFNALPYTVPGSLRIAMEDIDKHHGDIPRDRDIVLYCS